MNQDLPTPLVVLWLFSSFHRACSDANLSNFLPSLDPEECYGYALERHNVPLVLTRPDASSNNGFRKVTVQNVLMEESNNRTIMMHYSNKKLIVAA